MTEQREWEALVKEAREWCDSYRFMGTSVEQKLIRDLADALAASQEKERQYRIEADEAMRDYEALELVVQRALDLLRTSGSKLKAARALGEAEAVLGEALHGDGPRAALDSTDPEEPEHYENPGESITEPFESLSPETREELERRGLSLSAWKPDVISRIDDEIGQTHGGGEK